MLKSKNGLTLSITHYLIDRIKQNQANNECSGDMNKLGALIASILVTKAYRLCPFLPFSVSLSLIIRMIGAIILFHLMIEYVVRAVTSKCHKFISVVLLDAYFSACGALSWNRGNWGRCCAGSSSLMARSYYDQLPSALAMKSLGFYTTTNWCHWCH